MRRHLTGVSKSLSLVVSLHLVASTALGILQKVEFDDFPSTLYGCDFEAKELGERVKGYGISIQQSKCERDNKLAGTYTLSFTYDLYARYMEESTYKRGSNFYGRGWYKDRATCEADLSNQTRSFQLATGIEPYLAYCSKKGSSYSPYPYWPRIEALGRADMHLQASVINFSNIATVDAEAVEKDITQWFTHGPKPLVFLDRKKDSFALGFYSFGTDSIVANTLFRFYSLDDCNDKLSEIKKIYDGKSNPPLSLVCGEGLYTPQASLVAVSIGQTGVRAAGFYDYWSTKSLCESNLPNAISDLEASGEIVLGAVCSYDYGYYRPVTFHPR